MTNGKILGQLSPAATTEEDLYTVPANKEAQVNIFILNRGPSSSTFRIALRKAGVAISNEHYINYNTPIGPGVLLKIDGISLEATDIITVYAPDTNFSFTASGLEIS